MSGRTCADECRVHLTMRPWLVLGLEEWVRVVQGYGVQNPRIVEGRTSIEGGIHMQAKKVVIEFVPDADGHYR